MVTAPQQIPGATTTATPAAVAYTDPGGNRYMMAWVQPPAGSNGSGPIHWSTCLAQPNGDTYNWDQQGTVEDAMTSHGVSLTNWGSMWMAFKGASTNHIYTSQFSNNGWTNPVKIPNVDTSAVPGTGFAPAIVAVGNQLLLAWTAADTGELWFATSPDGVNWEPHPIGIPDKSIGSPALACYGNEAGGETWLVFPKPSYDLLYVVWTQEDGWEQSSPVSKFTGLAVSDDTPGMAYTNQGVLYLTWRTVQSNAIFWSLYDDDVGEFTVPLQIEPSVGTNGGVSMASQLPDTDYLLCFKGAQSSRVWLTPFNPVRYNPPGTGGATLGSNFNLYLGSNCDPILDLKVHIEITGTITGNNGFSFQLNANSLLSKNTDCVWQQYSFIVQGSVLSAFVNNWSKPDIKSGYFMPAPFFTLQPNLPVPNSLPEGTSLTITLKNDMENRVVSAVFQAELPNLAQGPLTVDLGEQPLGWLPYNMAPIVFFQLDLVGPDNGASAQLSGETRATVTYSASTKLSVNDGNGSCSYVNTPTGETSNSSYSQMPDGGSWDAITQTFGTGSNVKS